MSRHAWTVIDTDGRPCWGLCSDNKREVSAWARHPKRCVARIEITGFVRKSPKRRRHGSKKRRKP